MSPHELASMHSSLMHVLSWNRQTTFQGSDRRLQVFELPKNVWHIYGATPKLSFNNKDRVLFSMWWLKTKKQVRVIFEHRYHDEKWSPADLLRGQDASELEDWRWLGSTAHSSFYLTGILLTHFNSHSLLKSPLRCSSHLLWFVFEVAHRSFVFQADSSLSPHADSGGSVYPHKKGLIYHEEWNLFLLKSYRMLSSMYTQIPAMIKVKLQKQIGCSALIIPKNLQGKAQKLHWTLSWMSDELCMNGWIWNELNYENKNAKTS